VPEKDILIVDDEAAICELLAGALEDAGYAVDFAVTAGEAISLLHERPYRMVVVIGGCRMETVQPSPAWRRRPAPTHLL
jgi:DNA-binding response OmpR family regulator